MRVYTISLLLGIALISLTQCQPCEECGQLIGDPYVKLTIQPKDSLARLNPVRNAANTERNRLTTQLDRDDLTDAERTELQAQFDSVNSYWNVLTARRTLLNANKVRIDTVWAPTAGTYYVNEDTSNVFYLPLNPQADSSLFAIQLFDSYDTLKVRYHRREGEEDFYLEVFADSLALEYYSYDSAYVRYGDALKSAREAQITAIK